MFDIPIPHYDFPFYSNNYKIDKVNNESARLSKDIAVGALWNCESKQMRIHLQLVHQYIPDYYIDGELLERSKL